MTKQGGAKEKNKTERTNTTSDTSALLNRYLVKYDSSKKRKVGSEPVIQTLPEYKPQPNSVLYVIDVQNDFIDVPQDGLTGENSIGAFAVNNGSGFIEDLIHHINTHHGNYNEIIFSRDFHDKKHCSFIPTGGAFPAHCVIGTKGSGFFEGKDKETNLLEYLKTQKKDNTDIWKKIKIVFKGMHPMQDSFQAVTDVADHNEEGEEKHKTENLLSKRQVGNCCKGATEEGEGEGAGKCTDVFTGAKILRDTAIHDPLASNLFAGEPYWNLIKEHFLPYNAPEAENYYVCGLAGDFCVRDTALALKKYIRSVDPHATVNILHDFTRNAFLPASVPSVTTEYDPTVTYGIKPGILHADLENGLERNENNIVTGVTKLSEDVFKEKDGKEFQKYMFEMTDTPKPDNGNKYTYTFLTAKEVKEKTIPELPDTIFHFITDHRQIIDDYERNDIKMLTRTDPYDIYMEVNDDPGIFKKQEAFKTTGGKPRRTRKRSHRTRKHSGRKQKRSKRNSRKTRRSRRKRN